MKCKGKKDGAACGNVICKTDGKCIYIKDVFGGETKILPENKNSKIAIQCGKCGYRNSWVSYNKQ